MTLEITTDNNGFHTSPLGMIAQGDNKGDNNDNKQGKDTHKTQTQTETGGKDTRKDEQFHQKAAGGK